MLVEPYYGALGSKILYTHLIPSRSCKHSLISDSYNLTDAVPGLSARVPWVL